MDQLNKLKQALANLKKLKKNTITLSEKDARAIVEQMEQDRIKNKNLEAELSKQKDTPIKIIIDGDKF